MIAKYKEREFEQDDIRFIKHLMADGSLNPPKLGEAADEIGHPRWFNFFQKFNDVGGFDEFNEIRDDQWQQTQIDCWTINTAVAERILHLWANPPVEPPIDQVENTVRWFRSKKWFVPIYLLFVIIPAVIGYLTMIRMLLEWFGYGR